MKMTKMKIQIIKIMIKFKNRDLLSFPNLMMEILFKLTNAVLQMSRNKRIFNRNRSSAFSQIGRRRTLQVGLCAIVMKKKLSTRKKRYIKMTADPK